MTPARFPLLLPFLLLALLLRAAPSLGAAVAFSNASLPIAQLLVGDDLYATLTEAPPESPFELQLWAPDGVQLAAEMVLTDEAGNTPPVLLWVRTGVVGCNLCLPADPAIWRFQSFAQAEAVLANRLLTLAVVDPFSQQVLASATLPIAAPLQEIAYFSDAAGCPLEQFVAGAPIFLTLRHPDRGLPQRRLFLPAAPAGGGWPVGQPIADARGSRQLISVPPLVAGAADQITFPVAGTRKLPPGLYDGLLRPQTIEAPMRLRSDAGGDGRLVCERIIRGGIMITLDDCTNCPPG